MRLLVVLALAGCSKKEPPAPAPAPATGPARRELPGFSLEIPPGTETTSELDYNAGRIAVRLRDQPGFVHVRWSFAPEPGNEAELTELARGIALAVYNHPGSVHALDGGLPKTFALDKNESDLITYIRCGGRNILLTTTGAGRSTHNTVGRSIDCHPDAARERADIALPMRIDLPGFLVYERTPGMLILDDGTTEVRLRRQPSTPMTAEQLDRAMPQLLKAAGFTDIKTGRRGELVTFTATQEGQPRAGLMRYLECRDFEVQIFVSSEPDRVASFEPRVTGARCLAEGEQPSTWPDAPPVTDAPPASDAPAPR